MSAAEFIYTTLLKPKPLRSAANGFLRLITPAEMVRHGAVIVPNRRDPVISGALLFHVYERTETKFFLSMCRPGMSFLDIGANVGYYTALAMSRMQGEGRILALEPDPECYPVLLQTVAANRQESAGTDVTCLQMAAAAGPGKLSLFRNPDNRGDNRLYDNELANGSCEVEVAAVDDLLAARGCSTVDLIKIDVQGFEGKVFAGLRRTLQSAEETVILSEFWPDGLRRASTDAQELLTSLAQHGFTLFEMMPQGHLRPIDNYREFIDRHPGRKYTNIVAAKGEESLRRVERHA